MRLGMSIQRYKIDRGEGRRGGQKERLKKKKPEANPFTDEERKT